MPPTPQDSLETIIEQALIDIKPFTRALGGLEFYGASPSFNELFNLFEEFLPPIDPHSARAPEDMPRKIIVFLERYHGKTTLAKSLFNEIRNRISNARLYDGTVGHSWNELRKLKSDEEAYVIIDDLPESVAARRTAEQHASAFQGWMLLLTRPEYMVDARLAGITERITLSHVDRRVEDKVCWLVGLLWEELRAAGGLVSDEACATLQRIPAKTLATICEAPFGEKVRCLGTFAQHVAETLLIALPAEETGPLDTNELLKAFVAFYSPNGPSEYGAGYRVWVEGETDVEILKLAGKLATARLGTELTAGLAFRPLGGGREGGTSNITEVVVQHNTNKNRDLFVLDNDAPGRLAEGKLKTLNQSTKLLPKEFLRKHPSTDSSLEIEIEDLISLDCLDRFFIKNPNLTPEYEGLYYKTPSFRRLVIQGRDKDRFIDWLKGNAEFEDLERVCFLLCEIRQHFGLAAPKGGSEMKAWCEEICRFDHRSSSSGLRPQPWWHVSATPPPTSDG